MGSCPKNMLNGPCGGYRDTQCEVSGECVWVKLYASLHDHIKRYEVFTKVNLRPYFKLKDYYPPSRRALSKFMRLLNKGNVLIYEVFSQPTNQDLPNILNTLSRLSAYVDVFAIVDSPMGLKTYDQLTLGLLTKTLGDSDVMINIASRNKSVEELTKYLITSLNCDIRNLLIVTGDWPRNTAGTYFELDSTQLTYLCRLISDLGFDYSGRQVNLGSRPAHIGVTANQYSNYLELEVLRCVRKLRAGAEFVVTQPIYNTSRFRQFVTSLKSYSQDVHVVAAYAVIDSVRRLETLTTLGINLNSSERERITHLLRANDVITANEFLFMKTLEDVKDLSSSFYISTYGKRELALELLSRIRGCMKNL